MQLMCVSVCLPCVTFMLSVIYLFSLLCVLGTHNLKTFCLTVLYYFVYFVFLFCDSIAQRVFMEDVGECVVTWSWRVNFKEE